MPQPRDQKERPPCIPQSVSEAKPKQAGDKEKRNTEKDLENENGGAANDEWKEDVMPEILDGHNVYDFVDPDIVHRLEELKREAEEGDDEFEMDDMELTPEEQKTLV
ncbi:unnamed protein product [Prunus armeniaca]|uniref:NOG C-terminal domain-containing protein n=1 Tax=Prunus armeniaca TaxID=36596 RepID=A0A6J5WD30_PRUAR|nr:unnamed protein product [Prunus armeniaca]